LDQRGRELEHEKQNYVREAVRYERARIARELHDIVAHSMSIVVIQATAGQRLDDLDRVAVEDVLPSIVELVGQAESDIDGVARLLKRTVEPGKSLSRELIDALVRHAGTAGTDVEVHITGDLQAIDAPTAAALARTVQEGLTNALKHAPGAPVVVRLDTRAATTVLHIENAPPASTANCPDVRGAGRGLRGIRQRLAELGGSARFCATDSGGWLLSAELPTRTVAPASSATG
jgi:signal transduction histidine kinase